MFDSIPERDMCIKLVKTDSRELNSVAEGQERPPEMIDNQSHFFVLYSLISHLIHLLTQCSRWYAATNIASNGMRPCPLSEHLLVGTRGILVT